MRQNALLDGTNPYGCFLSHSQIELIFCFWKILIPMSEKNNPVRSDVLFDFYKYVSSRCAFLPTLVYIFHYVT